MKRSSRFTTYNRDSETGNDYAMARYYAKQYGAFLSPDPGHVGADPNDPRSWNAYVYGLSDPVAHHDPNGKEPVRNQLGSAADVGRVLKNVTNLTPDMTDPNLNPFQGVPKKGGPGAQDRYVFIEGGPVGRFIDMQHFLGAAAAADAWDSVCTFPPFGLCGGIMAWGSGLGVEISQLGRGLTTNPGILGSAFSEEDIFSNEMGILFYLFDYDKDKPLGPQIESFLTKQGALTPEQFGSKYSDFYNSLPAFEGANTPQKKK